MKSWPDKLFTTLAQQIEQADRAKEHDETIDTENEEAVNMENEETTSAASTSSKRKRLTDLFSRSKRKKKGGVHGGYDGTMDSDGSGEGEVPSEKLS